MTENRRHYRVEVELPARCHLVEPSGALGEPFAGSIHDVSSGGVALVSREELFRATQVYVEFRLGDLDIAADGVVTHREERDDGYVYGVEFTRVEGAEPAEITKYVFERARYLADHAPPPAAPRPVRSRKRAAQPETGQDAATQIH